MVEGRMNTAGSLQMPRALCAIALLICGWAAPASAQTESSGYPTRPIRIVVPYPPGGGVDILARVLAEKLPARWGQPVVVDNRSGAGGNVGTASVFQAAPDGHTLLFTAHPPLVVNKAIYSKLDYDPDAFEPVVVMATGRSMLIVHPKVPVTTLQEFIAYAKANPGKLNYSSQGQANAGHLQAEFFSMLAGIRMVHVPYKGGGPAFAALVAGEVEVMFGELTSADPYARAGKLRLLGYSGQTRHPDWPDVPAIAETLPRFVVFVWYGMVAPPGTPGAVTGKLAAAINDIVKLPDVAGRMNQLSLFPHGGTPQDMVRFMKEERERWTAVIRASGVKPE